MKTFVVSGAASGIGAATAAVLRDQNDRVITVDLHDADVVADLSTPAGRAEAVEAIKRLSDTVHGLVPCAGVAGSSTVDSALVVSVNFFGAVALAAFAYPLGNRGLLLHLEHSRAQLNAVQRVFGMTLCTWPLWLVFALFAWGTLGPPTLREAALAGGVALSSGTIATVMFFRATDMVRREPHALAAVEAMQAAELLFATVLGVLFLGEAWPRGYALLGGLAIMVGIGLFGWISGRGAAGDDAALKVLRSERSA